MKQQRRNTHQFDHNMMDNLKQDLSNAKKAPNTHVMMKVNIDEKKKDLTNLVSSFSENFGESKDVTDTPKRSLKNLNKRSSILCDMRMLSLIKDVEEGEDDDVESVTSEEQN